MIILLLRIEMYEKIYKHILKFKLLLFKIVQNIQNVEHSR